ncbi:SIMPL domain-containing protein [Phocaeicola abscessus]|uniref:SIMPL domain-containing protein n=1 Tax=Phocaeicola abscessus TaxID=555313 RepID=UPI000386C5BA|nr:SIMPL domain-containing protein [Phocaeicola abscessus]EPT34684.1 PF04402 family protein [Bacteroidetes bacterium oral taxon 272 str. F0290]
MKSWKIEAAIIAAGLLLMGLFIKSGLHSFSDKDRAVEVKGLAEMDVPANKVVWPLVYKEVGNDLTVLYNKIRETNATIVQFLKRKGIDEKEISIGAPSIVDKQADRYDNSIVQYRYNLTEIITVTSAKVDLIRSLITEQGELLKQGIAIVAGDWEQGITYEFTELNTVKPSMIEEATKNARQAAEKFAKDSGSKLGKIKQATQGQFSIEDRDPYTPHIKHIRVVTTIDYSLEN